MANKAAEEIAAEKAAAEAKKLEDAKKPKMVRVICEGVLGPLGLVKGETTSDLDYVALLKVKGQQKVEEVK
jgi:hypothetical protein